MPLIFLVVIHIFICYNNALSRYFDADSTLLFSKQYFAEYKDVTNIVIVKWFANNFHEWSIIGESPNSWQKIIKIIIIHGNPYVILYSCQID